MAQILPPASELQLIAQQIVDAQNDIIKTTYQTQLEYLGGLAYLALGVPATSVTGAQLSTSVYNALFDYLTITLGYTITNVVPAQQTTTFDFNW